MLKRLIPHVLIISLLLSTVIPVMGIQIWTVKADDSNTIHLRLNFNNYSNTASLSNPSANASGEIGGAWSLFGTAAGTDYAIGEPSVNEEGHYFTMVSNTTGQNINIQKNNLSLPGNSEAKTFLMSGRFKFNTTTHERRLFQTTVTNSPSTATVGTYTLFADTAGKLKIQFPTVSGNQTAIIGDYAANQWYEIELVFDLDNRKLHPIINGVEFAQTIDLGSTWNNLSSTRFVQIGRTGEEGKFSLDDIVYQSSVLTYAELYEEPSASATPEPSASATPEPSASATPEPSASATPEPSASTTPEPSPSAHPDYDRSISRTKYLSMNFDQYSLTPSTSGPSGIIGGNWGVSNIVANTDYLIGEPDLDTAGRYLTFYSTTGKNMTIVRYNQMIPSVKATPVSLVMEGKFLVNSKTTERKLFEGTLNHTTDASISRTLTISMDNAGNFKVSYPKVSAATGNDSMTFGTYDINRWYHVQAYIDWSNYTLSIFVNGEKLLSELGIGSNWNNVKDIRIQQLGKVGETVIFSIDDILIADFIPVDDIELADGTIRAIPEEEIQLTAAITPTDATNRYLNWSSSNPGVAVVDATGKITAISEGISTITVSSKEDNTIANQVMIEVSNYAAVTGISLLPSAVTIETERTAQLEVEFTPANATNQNVTWTSSNELVATVDHIGIVTGISPGTAIITTLSEEGAYVSTSEVTVTQRYTQVEGVSLPISAQMFTNDSISFTAQFTPSDATNQELRWESSNTMLATVDQTGRVYAGNNQGWVTITAYSVDRNEEVYATVEVQINEREIANQYDEMRLRWKGTLDGGETLNVSNSYVINKTKAVNQIAQALWDDMNKQEHRTTLWNDLTPSTTDSSIFNSYFTRLRDMTYAYSIKGGELYHNQTLKNDIVAALEWINEHEYNENITPYGNWWNFEIGAPLRITDILVMLYDDLDEELIQHYISAASHFIGDISEPTFDATGANRSDILTAVLLMGILSEDEYLIEEAIIQLSPLFDYVNSGDGFYEDGSFIQHSVIPYTGSYGEVLIRGLGQIFYLLYDSPFEITDPKANHVYRWIYEAVQPIIYNGETMDMVRGRAIAREKLSGHITTIGLLSGAARIALASPPQEQLKLKRLLKQWLEAMPENINYYQELRIDLIAPIEELMNDSSITALPVVPQHYELGAMNRSIHIREAFAVGISKSSNRIATYELTNGENGEGWYTGDGMLYLYNGDKNHYGDNYWATVNRYRLPGTTVDTRPRTNDHYQYGDGETTPANQWAGGVSLGTDGISGMHLQQVGTTLTAHKSWFMFGDRIVALGSAISSTDQRTIETIVEQRKLNTAGNNQFIVNGIAMSDALGWNAQLTDVQWAHLSGTNANANIGYYFIEGENIGAERKTQTGTWYQMNQNAGVSTDVRSDNYLTMYIDHGLSLVNKDYGYVLLPNYSAQETEQFANQPTIEVIENSTDIHAVRDLIDNQIGVNFWRDRIQTVDSITVNRKASIMVKENTNQTLDVAVSDPTFANTGTIEVELAYDAAAIIAKDAAITVTQLSPTIKFLVNTNQSLSKSFKITFDVDEDAERELPSQAWLSPISLKQGLSQADPIAYLFSTFDKEETGNAPQNWLITRDENTAASIVSDQALTDKHVRFIDLNKDGKISAAQRFDSQLGYLELEWNAVTLTENSELHTTVTGDDGIAVHFVMKNESLYYVDSFGLEQLITSLDAGVWLSIKLHLNIAEQYWDLLLDGNIELTNIPFKSEVSSVNQLHYDTGLLSEQTVVYVDDVVVYVPGALSMFTDEFEDEEIGQHPDQWIITQVNNAPVYVTTDDGLNQSLLIDDNTTTSSNLYYEFSPQQERMIVEWRFKEKSGGKYPEFQLRSGTTPVIRFSSSSNNYFRYYAHGATANSTLMNAPTKNNVWQHVKVDIDITSQTYTMYFNHVPVLQNEPFYNTASSINRLYFASGYGAVDAPLYIDSVKIYSYDQAQPVWKQASVLEVSNITDKTATISWEPAEDQSGIAQYELYVNEQPVQVISGLRSSWTLEALEAETAYELILYAKDHLGYITETSLESSFITLATPMVEEKPPGKHNPDTNDSNEQLPSNPSTEGHSSTDQTDKEAGIITTITITDIEHHWAKRSIERALALGIVTGYQDGTFRPNDTINRAEFAVMLSRAFQQEHSETALTLSLRDHDMIPAWAKQHIAAMIQTGWIKGYQDGTFQPMKELNRAELAVMIARAGNLETTEIKSLSFGDANEIPAWAYQEIQAAVEAGILLGTTGDRIEPLRVATRAEALTMILRLLELLS